MLYRLFRKSGEASIGLISWLSDPAHSGEVGAWSLVVRVLGTVITFLGFVFTIRQLLKTKSAAEAASKAVSDVKSRVAAYDVIYELSRAAASIRETQRHLRIPSWESALDSYLSTRDALVRLIELPSELSDAARGELEAMLADISKACDKIEGGLLKEKLTLDRAKIVSASREHEKLISKLNVSLHKEIK